MKKFFVLQVLIVIMLITGLSSTVFSQANTSLSNLTSPTSVNQSLLPSSDNTKDLGSSTSTWKNGYFKTTLFMGGSSATNGIQMNPNTTGKTLELRFLETSANGTNYVGFKAPTSISANKIWILPSADGTSGQVLSTNGTGTLSWVTQSGGGGTSVTANYIPRSDGSNLITGSLYDNGSEIGLGTPYPDAFLHISVAADADHPQLLLHQIGTDEYARIYMTSFTGIQGDERKWKILGRTSTTDANNNFYIQQTRFVASAYSTSTRFFIDYDGKIGLGTSLPNAKVHVNTDYNGNAFLVGPETGTPRFVVDGTGRSGFNVGNPNSRVHINSDAGEDALRVQVNSITKLYVASNGGVTVGSNITPPDDGLYVAGNTGMGTSSPQVRLHVFGTDEVLRLDGTNPYMQFFSGGVAKSYIQSTGSDFKLGTVGTNTSGKVQITTGSSTAMTLKSGKVGIGSTSPSVLLHLKGSNEMLRLEGTDAIIGFYSGSTQKAFIWRTGDDLKIASNSGRITLGNNVSGEQLFILSDGRVGIGTATPKTGYKLSVEGKIACRELKVETSTWPDYVFDPEYKLMPLTDVENFISQNNHLPGVASATEMQEDGISVGDMQNKLMQKIEELTLYMIDLQKQNDDLKKQMAALSN